MRSIYIYIYVYSSHVPGLALIMEDIPSMYASISCGYRLWAQLKLMS